ncbi:uncharacterized protein PHACADRAFT_246189 [Phanerochaete carnosa HHB-10118-sp]|uniref:Uncharacterized protein n=1 Tax=Phanerochaete carnosa (strain HHB-10118-sp) TaxID=650164 RepID=K5XBK5_PHACS|nr:uncharacterized protein PHACADRAFT_246189 [Phanerochaete carnosa HHB-10118-sp]EKM60327.1 hypothetical protein PHACADRAFT_246189 [Phanerochaete carnosa HHB-10118-sp]
MERLEELVLFDTTSSWRQIHETDSPGLHDTVILSRLRLLSINQSRGSSLASIPLLCRIAHPPSTAIRLGFSCLSFSHAEYDGFIRLLSAKINAWSDLDDPSFRSFRFDIDEAPDFYVTVSLWRDRLPLSSLQDSLHYSPFFQVSFGTDNKAFVADLLRRLPLTDVTTAFITDDAALWGVAYWEEMLSLLRSVEELTLRYKIVSSTPVEPHGAHTLCPRLQVLRICECEMDQLYADPRRSKLIELAYGFVVRGGDTLTVRHLDAGVGGLAAGATSAVRGLPSLGQNA